jgi:PAS domain S-box-containing protein
VTGTKKELRVLVVEDMAADMTLINHELRRSGLNFRSRRVESREAFLHELEHHAPDVILSDHGVPGFDGFAALEEARKRCPEVPFIFVTGAPREEVAAQTLQSGADDYVLKNNLNLLVPAIQRALNETDRRRLQHLQLEAALLSAEEQLYLLAKEVREYAMFMLDAKGGVASWNAGAEQMLGYEPNEILGKNFARFFSRDAQEKNLPRDLIERATGDGRVEEVGWRTRKNGDLFRATTTLIPLRRVATLRGFLCLFRDQSRHSEETEAEVREHLARVEAENREMEEFTHAISLDLRSPLRHIESFSQLLLKTAPDRLDDKSQTYLKTISESAHRMSRLVDDLFTFSRIGQAEMYRLHTSIAEIVKEVIHDLRHETEGRDVQWVIGKLPEAMGDPVMLWRVMTILISNALKFTRPRKHARIEIGSEENEREFIFYVRDNGVGFDNHYADRLFGVFQKLHAKEFEGTGVGLANVRRIIHRHGGNVWAEGEADEGATFYFSLPK